VAFGKAVDRLQQVFWHGDIDAHGAARDVETDEHAGRLVDVGIDGDFVECRRFRQSLAMFQVQGEMALQRLLGIHGGLVNRGAGAGAAGNVWEEDAVAGFGAFDDGDVANRMRCCTIQTAAASTPASNSSV